MGRLIIDGGKVYELDEACLKEKNRQPNDIRSAGYPADVNQDRKGQRSGENTSAR